MAKVLIVLLTGTDPKEHATALHALLYAKGLAERGQDVKLVFDGAGTGWAPLFSAPDNPMKPLFDGLNGSGIIIGACEFCAGAFKVGEAVRQAGVCLLGDAGGHPDIPGLVASGYQLVVV
ncbi:MAG: DsrE family protein [Chloroflexi bacterium]|nr:DsrE family protein [Chloroflexota bacterium]